MPKKNKSTAGLVRDVSTYRGRSIEVLRPAATAKNARPGAVQLLIDGVDIPLELTELGYLSHAHMFTAFSTPFELAEDLIRQFGDAPVRYAPHDHGGHNHDDEDDDDDHNADHHDHNHDHDH